uniref:CYP79A117 n=1 Tax=Metasequoia glyptostroboides TaxID=3371 RepID=A0A288W874_METGY|nr:CYP79A117 [Metasequoia glyptostroboides]
MENVSRFISFVSFSCIPSFWNEGNQTLHDQIHAAYAAFSMNFSIAIFPTIAILIITSSAFSRLFKSKTRKSYVPLPPGPQPWPLVGSLPELLYSGPGYKWFHSLLDSYEKPILCVRLGSVHVIAVNSPDIAREFLKKHDAVFASRPITMATSYSSRGFLSIAVVPWGDQWKKMRRVVASEVLTASRLKWLQGKRMEEADNLVHWIWNQCSAQSPAQPNTFLNVRYAVRHYSANVIRKLIFNRRYFTNEGGSNEGGPTSEEEEHVNALFKVLSLLYNMCVSDYMPCLRWLDIGGNERDMKKAIHVVDKYHIPLIEERFRLRRGCTSLEEPHDLLDVLISIKDSTDGSPLLRLEEIKSQLADLTYATVDNPSNAVEWALAEMLLQPEIMQKAVEEIDRVVGKDRLVHESDLGHLKYVKACVKEALRLHPVAPFNLPHMSMEDVTVAGYHIPKGSHVLLSRVGLGRNPCVWEDPLRFCPERFLKDDSRLGVELGDPELRLISFSTGRRGCMGAALGTAMTVMLLARLLHCFHWSTSSMAPIHLQEGPSDLFMANPLHAIARPRLPRILYP